MQTRSQYRAALQTQAEAFWSRRHLQWAVWCKSKGRCWYCGTQTTMGGPWHRTQFQMGHLLPVAQGGSDALDNLVPTCAGCTARKRSLTLEEFRQREWLRYHPQWPEDLPADPPLPFWFELAPTASDAPPVVPRPGVHYPWEQPQPPQENAEDVTEGR